VSFLDEALRAHADGDLCAEAAAGLLIAGHWLDRDDFTGRFVTVAASPGSGTRMAVIDWPAAVGALGRGLPCSDLLSGERRLPQVTASLAAGIPAGLRDAAAGCVFLRGVSLLGVSVMR